MAKIIFLITLLALTSTVLNKQYWECDSRGRYVCLTSQTCCQNKVSSTGWACFNLINAVCCSDGISACPNGYICNLRAKTCDRRAFLFGGEDSQCELFSEGIEPIDSFNLFKGFMEGLAIFEKLPHADQCTQKDLEVIEGEILEIVNILRTIEFNYEAIVKLTQIFSKFKELYDSFNKVVGPCQEYVQELRAVMKKVIDHVETVTYLTQLPVHIIMELGNLKTAASKATEEFNQGHYMLAGQGFGGLVHNALLWEF
jgi:hypothetical protein